MCSASSFATIAAAMQAAPVEQLAELLVANAHQLTLAKEELCTARREAETWRRKCEENEVELQDTLRKNKVRVRATPILYYNDLFVTRNC